MMRHLKADSALDIALNLLTSCSLHAEGELFQGQSLDADPSHSRTGSTLRRSISVRPLNHFPCWSTPVAPISGSTRSRLVHPSLNGMLPPRVRQSCLSRHGQFNTAAALKKVS